MRRRIPSLALALALCLGLAAPAALAAETDTERGVLTYTTAVAPQYEAAGPFSGSGLAPVQKDGKWGYIDTDGEVVIPFQYDRAFAFNEGKAIVATADRAEDSPDDYVDFPYVMGFVDEAGNYTPFTPAYSYGGNPYPCIVYSELLDAYSPSELFFHNGFAMLPEERGFKLIYTADGSQLPMTTEFESYATAPANEGLIPYVTDAVWSYGWMDYNGNIVMSFDENSALEYFGPTFEHTWETDWGEEYTTTVQSYRFIGNVLSFNQGLAPVWKGTWNAETDEVTYQFGLMDTSFQWVMEPQFTNYFYSGVNSTYQLFGSTGLAMVEKDGKFGAIDKAGNTVIPFQYDELWPVCEGRIVFQENGKYGYLDAATLQVAIPAQFEKASGFHNGLAVVYDGAKAYLIDKKGEAVPGADNLDPSTYFVEDADGTQTVYTPDEYVVIEENGKYGYGHIEYKPALPEAGEMSSWAYEEVTAAIEEDLVPTDLQNLYLNNITRAEFSELVVQAISEVLDQDIRDVVLDQTGKSLSGWQMEYPFVDTADSDVIAAYALGIVSGRGNGIFDPYAAITRQEAAALLMRSARVLGMDTSNIGSTSFEDSGDVGVWFTDAVNFVYQINVMNGTGDNTFTPLGSYTREQSYVTIYRLFLAVVGDQI